MYLPYYWSTSLSNFLRRGVCERNGPIPGQAGNVPFPLPHLKILSTLFTWPQNGVWRWCPLHNFTDFVLIPHPPNDQCFRCQLELFIGGNIFVCFSLKVSRIQPSSLRPRCVTCCVLSAICWAGHLCPLAQGTTVSSPPPCSSWSLYWSNVPLGLTLFF